MMSQDEVSEQADAVQISRGQILNITLLASEWKSAAGGLSTLNRELAIHLSQIPNVTVSLFAPEGACNDEDKMEAGNFGIIILDAKECVDLEPLLWLSNPPQDHKIDVIVGHGVKVGSPVQLIKRQAQFQNCKWVHVVHTAPEDLSIHKDYSNPISRGQKKHQNEVDLCKRADLVVPVGPKLGEAYRAYLQSFKKDDDFFELTPGLFEREFGALNQRAKNEKDKNFIVLLCGRGDEEDFELKGYNIAVKAFADQQLKGKNYILLFVGSPEGKHDEVSKRLLRIAAMDKNQLRVREFVKSREGMKELFFEVDMVIMPSKSEGFGLVALEALSAGLPILVGRNSGFARAIEDIPLGLYSIVDSEDAAKWAEAIQGVRDRHRVVLQENKILKEHYSKEYCWKTQCEELIDRLWKMVYGASAAQAMAVDDLVQQCPNVVPESVCQPDPTKMQQHIVKGAVTSGRGQEGSSGTSRVELTMPELADFLIRLKIEAAGLNEEQKKDVYDMLTPRVTTFMKTRNYSKVKVTGVRALLEFLEKGYNLSQVALDVGSLIISLDCKTLRGLDQLWNDYLSGHLNKVAERYLVTDEMKKRLNLRKINLKTTIEKENYLNCRKVLMERSGEADSTTLSSQQGALGPETGMTGMARAADDEELLICSSVLPMIGAWIMAKYGDMFVEPNLIILAVVVTFIGVIVGFVALSGDPSRTTQTCSSVLLMIGAWMMAKSGDISKPDLIILAVVVTFIGVIVGFVVLSGGPSRATLICSSVLLMIGAWMMAKIDDICKPELIVLAMAVAVLGASVSLFVSLTDLFKATQEARNKTTSVQSGTSSPHWKGWTAGAFRRDNNQKKLTRKRDRQLRLEREHQESTGCMVM